MRLNAFHYRSITPSRFRRARTDFIGKRVYEMLAFHETLAGRGKRLETKNKTSKGFQCELQGNPSVFFSNHVLGMDWEHVLEFSEKTPSKHFAARFRFEQIIKTAMECKYTCHGRFYQKIQQSECDCCVKYWRAKPFFRKDTYVISS